MNRAAGKCRTFEEVLVEQSAPSADGEEECRAYGKSLC